jgi:hypothetical protein
MLSSLTAQGGFLPLAVMEVVKKYMFIISLHKKRNGCLMGLTPLCASQGFHHFTGASAN